MEAALPRIVLADDDGDLRSLYASSLRAWGFAVFEAVDGRDALAKVREIRPALLLMDLWMPGLNGFEVLHQLRHEPAGALLTVVMLSCMCDSDARLECFAAGADAFLVKGLALADLQSRVRAALDHAADLLGSP